MLLFPVTGTIGAARAATRNVRLPERPEALPRSGANRRPCAVDRPTVPRVLPQPTTVKRDPTSPERFLIVDGRVWRVYESRLAEGAEPSLIFSNGGQIRFVPRFPIGWYELADDRLTDLYWDADF